jgi:hypothetical protein
MYVFLLDHNQYIYKNKIWQSNYCAGLRILDASLMTSGILSQIGYFDVDSECDTTLFSGIQFLCRRSMLLINISLMMYYI